MPGMPALPEDAEACGTATDHALRIRRVELPQRAENGTCSDGGAAACYCGLRLRRLTCGAAEGRRWAPPRAAAQRLERDCARAGGLAGCSRCLRALNQVMHIFAEKPTYVWIFHLRPFFLWLCSVSAEEWQQQQQQQHRRRQRQQQQQTGLSAHGIDVAADEEERQSVPPRRHLRPPCPSGDRHGSR